MDSDDLDRTALHKCVVRSEPELAALLLDWIRIRRSDRMLTEATDRNGDTPLQLAAKLGSLTCLQVLVLQSPVSSRTAPTAWPTSLPASTFSVKQGVAVTEIATTESQEPSHSRSQGKLMGRITEHSADRIAQSSGYSSAAKSIPLHQQASHDTLVSGNDRGQGPSMTKQKDEAVKRTQLRSKLLQSIHYTKETEGQAEDNAAEDEIESNSLNESQQDGISAAAVVKQLLVTSARQADASRAAQRARIQRQQLLAAGPRAEPAPSSHESLVEQAEEEDSRPPWQVNSSDSIIC